MVQTSPNNDAMLPSPSKPADSVLPARALVSMEELIGLEKLMVRKCKAYGLCASDPNLKALYERAELMHHHHLDILTGCLQAGNRPGPAAAGMA